MESVDSSPNYSRPRNRFDANKENYPRGSDYDEMTSTYGSPLNKPYTRKPSNNGIKHRTTNKKNIATLRSFRRRPKPRPIQPISDSDESLLDSSESSPHYLKATTSSKGKKSTHSESTLDGSDKNSTNSSKFALSKTSSFRSVRILIKRGSFKPKRSLLRHSKVSEDVHVDRATYSSTLKDSKFLLPVEVLQEPEKSPAVRVCRYHHCSLHGGCHGGEDPAPPPKRFLYKRRQSMRRQRGMVLKAGTRRGEKVSSDGKMVESSNNGERLSVKVSVSGVENEIGDEGKYPNEETEIIGDGCEDDRESYLIELVFGETSFPERSYEDSLQIRRKYTLEEQNGYCSACSCHKREDQDVATTPKRVEAASSSPEGTKNNEEITQNVSDLSLSPISLSPFEKAKESDNFSVVFDEISEKRSASSSSVSSNGQTSTDSTNSEEDADSITESSPPEDSKAARTEDSETKSSLHFSKPRHMSMWYMIHQHMSSNVAVESTNKPDQEDKDVAPLSNELSEADVGTENNNETETQEIELRKLFAVKLVREAIERILLPEVQDQSSDDQSTPRACNDAESDAERVNDNVSSDPIEEEVENGDASGKETKESEEKVERKSEKKAAPKHWSNLKKWILLQRFIRELEKVKRFNPKKPRILPLNPDPEAEKVSLRPQTVDERKSAEEWMLDHALRQAVSQLAPTQKKKVVLLVKAFETVVPPQESSDQVQSRRLVGSSSSLVANSISIFGSPISKARSLNLDGNGNVMENEAETEDVKAETEGVKAKTESKNHIKMWHMIYQHVVSNIAEKVGGQLLEGGEGEEEEEEGLTKSDALKLVKEAVDEILVPETQDDVGGENAPKEEESKVESKSKNWSKLKKIILLKRSIKALEKARKLRAQPHQVLPRSSDLEPDKVDLRQKAMDERKKAEQWMLDYAVQHIVTTLTPARKRRVSMLVEAFEAVVPLPEA